MAPTLLVERFFGLTAIVALLTAAALGQGVRGYIYGKVTDQKGKRIPGATVTIANPKIKVLKQDTTSDKGHFTIPQLQPSIYIVKVDKEGYQPFEKTVILEPMKGQDASPIRLSESSKAGNTSNQERAPGPDELHIILTPLGSNLRDDSGPRINPIDDPGNQTYQAGSAGAQGAQTAPTQSQPTKPASDEIDAGRLQLQALSGERSDVITNNQVKNLALNGRDIIEFLKLMPGVVSDFNGQISNPGGLDRFFINGTRGNQRELAIDGVSNVDTATNGSRHVTINPDAVAEIKVLTANYQAEYGKAAGGFIQIVTKSGTTEFHGGARFFHRHEGLNANNFFNNAQGLDNEGKETLPRPLYRYNDLGYDLGGPVYLPRFGEGGSVFKKINDLFFFLNQEFYRQLAPNPLRFIRVPTEQERRGDFSKSGVDRATGKPTSVEVKDPIDNRPFPENNIPQNRWYPYGQAILNLYPLPNTAPSANNNFANYVSQNSTKYPRSETVVRLDYKLGEQTELSGRVIHNSDEQALPFGSPDNLNLNNTARIFRSSNPNAQNFDKWNVISPRPGINVAFTLTHSFNQTLTNEFIFGLSRSRSVFAPEADKATLRANNLGGFPLLFPNANPDGFIPNFNFGILIPGGSGDIPTYGPATTFDGLPFKRFSETLNFTDSLIKVWNAHLIKAGVFLQQSRGTQTIPGPNTADVGFDAGAFPNTGHAFANALLGVYSQYDQSEKFLTGFYRYRNVEGYIQDLWRLNDRFVLDLGLRLSWYQPQYETQLQASFFDPALFDPLVAPTPDNLAHLNNGFRLAGQSYPRGGIEGRGAQWGPRFGFAYDLLGAGRTILRGGFGIFYDRVQGGVISDMLKNPPSSGVARTLRFGMLAEINKITPSMASFFPPTVYGVARDGKIPAVYSYSLNLQRDIGWGTVVDVAYVGAMGRRLVQARNLNAVPYGATFERKNQDPTRFLGGVVPEAEAGIGPLYVQAGLKFSGEFAKPTDLLRPFPGYGDIRYYEFGGSSNYNSLQISARRRFSRDLTLSLAHTWSKAFDTANDDMELTNPFNPRRYDYRLAAFDRTHVFAASFVYTLPKLSRQFGNHRLAKTILDGWQLSGIAQFSSGQPFEVINLSLGDSKSLTGSSTELTRLYLRGGIDPKRGPNRLQINPAAFIPPKPWQLDPDSKITPAPAPRNYLRGPGVNNWDISIFKNIPLGGESRYFQLRLEMFNAFNHTQFNSVNSVFNPSNVQDLNTNDPYIVFPTRQGIYHSYLSGRLEILPLDDARKKLALGRLFGDYSSARDPRIIQLAAKFYF